MPVTFVVPFLPLDVTVCTGEIVHVAREAMTESRLREPFSTTEAVALGDR